jgi:hypothetical protein
MVYREAERSGVEIDAYAIGSFALDVEHLAKLKLKFGVLAVVGVFVALKVDQIARLKIGDALSHGVTA